MKIELFGEIVREESVWIYEFFKIPCCCPRQVRDAIAALGVDEELVVEINSPGGDVWAGFEIFGLLQAYTGHTEAHITALAASAATTVSSACKKVLASPVAQFMIHQPSAWVDGYMNNTTAGQLKNFLDSVKASIINGYVVKSAGKASRRTLEKLVDDSTWMPAQKAIELGLVDGLLDTDEDTAAILAASGGVAVRNAAGLSTTPQALMERYEAAVRAGTMEAVAGHPVSSERAEGQNNCSTVNSAVTLSDDWRLHAAVELERARAAYEQA